MIAVATSFTVHDCIPSTYHRACSQLVKCPLNEWLSERDMTSSVNTSRLPLVELGTPASVLTWHFFVSIYQFPHL